MSNIEYDGKDHKIYFDEKLQAGPITHQIRKKLIYIQEGKSEDKYGWSKVIN